jgi:hypothetical protein
MQILPEAPNQTDLREPQRPMGGRTQLVRHFCVGSEFKAALGASPFFSRDDQTSPDTAPPRFGFDEPALEIAHSIGSTALGVRANRNLGKAHQARLVPGDQDCARLAIGKDPVYLLQVLRL